MDRLRHIAIFLVITAVVFGALRLLHLGIPMFSTRFLAGPFKLERVDLVAQYTGFSPRLPFYRPEQLGPAPIDITVSRRPHPKVVILWQGEHFLYLAEQQGGDTPPRPSGADVLPGHPDSSWVQQGGVHRVIVKVDDLWIELRTDLSSSDVQRIVDTLRPYEALL